MIDTHTYSAPHSSATAQARQSPTSSTNLTSAVQKSPKTTQSINSRLEDLQQRPSTSSNSGASFANTSGEVNQTANIFTRGNLMRRSKSYSDLPVSQHMLIFSRKVKPEGLPRSSSPVRKDTPRLISMKLRQDSCSMPQDIPNLGHWRESPKTHPITRITTRIRKIASNVRNFFRRPSNPPNSNSSHIINAYVPDNIATRTARPISGAQPHPVHWSSCSNLREQYGVSTTRM